MERKRREPDTLAAKTILKAANPHRALHYTRCARQWVKGAKQVNSSLVSLVLGSHGWADRERSSWSTKSTRRSEAEKENSSEVAHTQQVLHGPLSLVFMLLFHSSIATVFFPSPRARAHIHTHPRGEDRIAQQIMAAKTQAGRQTRNVPTPQAHNRAVPE